MPDLRRALAGERHVIIESNSVLRFLRPDVYLTVLDPATADFKESAREYLDLASALVLHQRPGAPTWRDVSLKPAAGKPVFYIHPPQYCSDEIAEFVRRRLGEL